MSILYVVATPIGNREDLSDRARRILSEVDLIACEDTRVTKRFLESYSIYTPLVSYHAQSPDRKEAYICDLLEKGKNIALVSDAGTPAISDPGSRLVARVHASVTNAEVVVVPGPSAGVALLSGAGIQTQPHIFYGFLPQKKGRKTLLDEIKENDYTSVLYESPHRFMKLLESFLEREMGDRIIVVGRELTKMHEEIVKASVQEIHDYYTDRPDTVKGEFVVAVSPQR